MRYRTDKTPQLKLRGVFLCSVGQGTDVLSSRRLVIFIYTQTDIVPVALSLETK
jgi:hypothetical protein